LRPPKCCLLVGVPLLLLFRGLLRGLLCGCLLGCFLSCHLPILPFRWFASRSATFVAVEEMYSFMRSQCQEKNDDGVEKVATTTSTQPFTCSSSQNVSRVKKCHCQSRHRIVPRMSEDSSAQIPSEESEQTEECAEHGKHEHRARTLVSMCCAEDYC
jgi:hypothetical protein